MGWFGNWFGAVVTEGGGGGGPAVITQNPTTAEALRDHIIALIEAIAPTMFEGDRFERFLNEREANFLTACEAAAAGAFRRFQVRSTGANRPGDVSNMDVQSQFVTFTISVAYPQTNRAGKDNALDRDDVMSEDERLIVNAVGLDGYVNFTGASVPNATWVESATERVEGNGIDLMVITQTMRFYRRMFP